MQQQQYNTQQQIYVQIQNKKKKSIVIQHITKLCDLRKKDYETF